MMSELEVHIIQSFDPQAGWVKPGHRRSFPRSPTGSFRQLESACESCRSTAALKQPVTGAGTKNRF